MKLKRFLTYFMRVQHSEPDETVVHFRMDDQERLILHSIEFDADTNNWTVHLKRTHDR
jgi:hypothetical protein